MSNALNKMTGTIGLIWDDEPDVPLNNEVLSGVLSAAQQAGQLVLMGNFGQDRNYADRLMKSMISNGASGFIYASSDCRPVSLPAGLRPHQVILLNCTAGHGDRITVLPDERGAGRAAVQAVVRAGQTGRIIVLGEGFSHRSVAEERLTGILAGLSEAGLTATTILHGADRDSLDDAEIRRLVSKPSASAVICLQDQIAAGVHRTLKAGGRRIPDEVSVVVFGCQPQRKFLHPALTSVPVAYFEMGRRAVTELMTAMSGASDADLVPVAAISESATDSSAAVGSVSRIAR